MRVRSAQCSVRSWIGAAAACLLAMPAAAQKPTAYQELVGRLGDPVMLLRAGQYKSAIEVLSAIPKGDSAWSGAQPLLINALATVGRYDEAERVGREAVATDRGITSLVPTGDVLRTRGKRVAAESMYVRAMAVHSPDSLTAKVNRAALMFERGSRDSALTIFDSFIDVYNHRGPSLNSDELVAVAIAVRYLGVRDPQLFKDALKAFDGALRVDPQNDDARILLGNLFLEKYNYADAQTEFDEVLRTNPTNPGALTGAAERRAADGEPGVDSLLNAALAVNADFVPALLLVAEHRIDVEDYAGAQQILEHVLRIDPMNVDAIAMNAAASWLRHDLAAYEAGRQRAQSINPKDAQFFVTMANLTSRVRLYDTAAAFARQAVAVDSTNWKAHAQLGMNLLRMGRVDDARKSLERAFAADPYDLWTKNTLDLLDTYKDYDIVPTEHFRLMIDKAESGLFGVYLGDLAEQAYKTYSAKYGYTPNGLIRIEVYRSHADFSVRTVGLAGIGALGVSFGNTLAFDSPVAKDAGPFNWGSTVWHELAHTFTLGLTDHRVPRWLSEGLSVYEEHRARPGWGFTPSAEFLVAFKKGKLVPVSRMNDGFMRPAYPEQVQFSYYQASLVCELIARDYGGDKALLDMLLGYKAGLTTEEVFAKVLKTDLKGFDKKFDDYLRQRFATPLAALSADSVGIEPSQSTEEIVRRAGGARNNYWAQMVASKILIDRGDGEAAVPLLERAREIFPENTSPDGPYDELLKIATQKNDAAGMIRLLRDMVKYGITDYGPHIALANLLEAANDLPGAADAYERAMFINPFDASVHEHMADLYQRLGNKAGVVRERRVVVGLHPVDMAGAYYRLALAQDDAGDQAGARRSVVRSLEIAPNFVQAQDLLLKLHGGAPEVE